MKLKLTSILLLLQVLVFAQKAAPKVDPLTNTTSDGRMELSNAGASYFAKLSLECASKVFPHSYSEHHLETAADLKTPDKLNPSFYGCFDWHSGVHNHWAMVKLLKTYPNLPEAKLIKAKLEQSFDAKNILVERDYLKKHAEENFEFPYGTSWLLKVADELSTWNDPTAKKWLKNLEPLCQLIVANYMEIWPSIEKATYTGNHYASSLGISFALDYAITTKNDSLKNVLIEAANNFFKPIAKFPLEKEPFGYDFMSAGLLITDLMRKVMLQDEYTAWLKKFSPDMFTLEGVKKVFVVKKLADHTGYSSHFDGFHLNRIWCINSMIKALPANALTPEVKKSWLAAQREMWDYSQASIGKGNYDIDHWLSTFSVYALLGDK